MFKALLAAILVVFITAVSALAVFSNQATTKANGVSVEVTSNGITEDISQVSDAPILLADNLFPGETRTAEIGFRNTGEKKVGIQMSTEDITHTNLAAANNFILRVVVGDDMVYNERLAAINNFDLGNVAPGEYMNVVLEGNLDIAADNSSQAGLSQFNIKFVATNESNPPPPPPPPPECVYQDIRARMLVFRGKPAIRLLSRYRATRAGKVTVRFYKRVYRDGRWRKGERLATMRTNFRKSKGDSWNQRRVIRRISEDKAEKLREYRGGFVAELRVTKTPGYCQRFLSVDLLELKRYYRQYVWFQDGSFRYRN